MKHTCRICSNSNENSNYTVREMMLGTRDEFEYFQCSQCGCLQISTIPGDLDNYYPKNYYSFNKTSRFVKAPVRGFVDRRRVSHILQNNSFFGNLINNIARPLEYISWVKNANIGRDARILDIGCGQGRLLLRMSLGGFRHLTGLDPFIDEDMKYDNDVSIIKKDLADFSDRGQKFDFIMLHHSLEHMPDQHESLNAIARLLAPAGVILIRIPLADSYAWEHYRENWVQLDAPRHLYLHSKESLSRIADACGLFIENTVYDSARFQFTGSELYRKGIPLSSDKEQRNIFSRKQLDQFTRKANELNFEQRGDQAEFYLRLR